MPRPVHFEIHASDPERVQAFYRELFGWRFQQWGDQDYWAVFTESENESAAEPGINGGLLLRQGEDPAPSQQPNAWVCTVSVDDCKAYLNAALRLGATEALPLSPVPGIGWVAYILDPAGNVVGLMEEDPNAG